jgi:lipopolysaccharide export system permease protein
VTILDRYITRQYLANCAILLLVLCALVVMIDLFLNLDRFVGKLAELHAAARGVPEEEVRLDPLATTIGVIKLAVDFYWPQLLRLATFLLGTVLLAAMGFTFSQMARKRELTAVLASGVSLPRLAVPVLLLAALLCGAQLLSQETVIPRYKHLIARSHSEIGERNLEAFRVPFTPDAQGRLFAARRFDERSGALEQLTVIERSETKLMRSLVTAERAVWDGEGWVLEEGRRRWTLLPEMPELPRPEPVARLDTNLDPPALLIRKHQALRSMLSWQEIERILEQGGPVERELRSELQRVRWGRLAMMANNLLMLAVLIPFFLVREPRNMAIQALKAVPVGMLTGVVAVFGVMLVTDPVPAAWGVWLSSLVLLPIALASWTMVRT